MLLNVDNLERAMHNEMLTQMNAYFREEMAALKLHIERLDPIDFMEDAKRLKDCQWMAMVSVDYNTPPPPSEWREVARNLALLVSGKLIGNCATFFASVPIVRQIGNCVYVQLLRPEA